MITQGNKCPVCLKLYHDARWMPCKHIYCFKCIPHLHRRDLDTKEQITLECRICAMQHSFCDWSAIKYYATLHCIPYVTALQFDNTSTSLIKSSCSTCFNVINEVLDGNHLEYCIHCKKNICHECFINHRMELKKNILNNIDQCRGLIKKNQQHTEQVINKLENIKLHIDFCAFELNDQIDGYSDSIVTQIDEQKLHEETNSSSGYESLIEQRSFDADYDVNHQLKLSKNLILTEPSIIPIHLLGKLSSQESNTSTSSISQILWTMVCSFHPSHFVFELHSSKLFICSQQGYVIIYSYNTSNLSLVQTFYLQYNETFHSIIIKSLAASACSLIVVLNTSIESILQFYSHNGHLLRCLSLSNEYISQIRFNNNSLWCLELISSSLYYFICHSNDQFSEKTPFISFKQISFNPFRFAVNQLFVAIMNRTSPGLILLFDKQTATCLKQIESPLNNFQSCDIELTNQMLIYRFPHLILLIQLDNEQFIEQINANNNTNITIGKSNNEILISTSTNDDNNTFIIQCYGK